MARLRGSDIMIHGKSCSVGCLAMGGEVIEEIFTLSAETGIKNIKVILSPVDFRRQEMPKLDKTLPSWTGQLYSQIRQELSNLDGR